MIHSDIARPDEAELNFKDFLKSLSGYKFAVGIVSNPDLTSFLDKGQIKVRYRYVVAPLKGRAIQDNTREFCRDLIRADKIYRREDINIMSFRGANPIAKQNYSIFRLRGHWNCRHVWQREIYFVEEPGDPVENSELIDKKIAMSKPENKSAREIFANFFKNLGMKLSKEDIVEINKVMVNEGVAFADVKDAEGRTMRVDGEELAVGAAVMWILEDGTEGEVADGTYSIPDMQKSIVVEGGKITEVNDAESAEDTAAAGEDTPAAEAEMAAQFKKLEGELDTKIKNAVAEALKEHKFSADDAEKMIGDKIEAAFSKVTEDLKSLPAFGGEGVSHSFSSDDGGSKGGSTISERLTADWNIPEKK